MKEGGEEGEENERICFLVLSFTDHSCYLFSTPTQPHTQPHQTPTVNHLGVEEVHLARQPFIARAHEGSAVLYTEKYPEHKTRHITSVRTNHNPYIIEYLLHKS